MIGKDYLVTMAAYNRWQNENLYTAAATLEDAARRLERGAFFGSVHGTLNHLLWADEMWMSRFAGTPKPQASLPQSVNLRERWDELERDRKSFDKVIADWAADLDPAWLAGDMTWHSGATGRDITKPKWLLVTHMFNHQTHHRGQVHAMLTAAGAKPAPTDLAFMA